MNLRLNIGYNVTFRSINLSNCWKWRQLLHNVYDMNESFGRIVPSLANRIFLFLLLSMSLKWLYYSYLFIFLFCFDHLAKTSDRIFIWLNWQTNLIEIVCFAQLNSICWWSKCEFLSKQQSEDWFEINQEEKRKVLDLMEFFVKK